MGSRNQGDDFGASKADMSDSWGSDRTAQPPPGRAGGGGGGFSGRESRTDSFSFGAADSDDNWGRGRGGGAATQQQAPLRSGAGGRQGFGEGPGMGSFGRADSDAAWGKEKVTQPAGMPRRGSFNNASGALRDDEPWSRGRTQQPQPELPRRGSGLGFSAEGSRADDPGAWAKTSAVQPAAQGPTAGGPRADEESRWSKGAAPQPQEPSRLREVEVSDDWNRGKSSLRAGSSGRGPGSTTSECAARKCSGTQASICLFGFCPLLPLLHVLARHSAVQGNAPHACGQQCSLCQLPQQVLIAGVVVGGQTAHPGFLQQTMQSHGAPRPPRRPHPAALAALAPLAGGLRHSRRGAQTPQAPGGKRRHAHKQQCRRAAAAARRARRQTAAHGQPPPPLARKQTRQRP